MMLLKITNLVNSFGGGSIDYKGLDIEQFIAGSQQYMDDLSFCIVATKENVIPNHADLTVLDEQEYLTLKEEIQATKGTITTLNDQQRLTLLEQALDDLLLGGGM